MIKILTLKFSITFIFFVRLHYLKINILKSMNRIEKSRNHLEVENYFLIIDYEAKGAFNGSK